MGAEKVRVTARIGGAVAEAGRDLRAAGMPGPARCSRGLLLLAVLGGLLGAGAAEAQELYVADKAANAVTVYSRTANGDTFPLRILQGTATGLDSPSGLVVTHDELFVANRSTTNQPTITVYLRTASGDTRPLRTLKGQATQLDSPSALAVTPDELFVANQVTGDHERSITESSITVYKRSDRDNAPPLRTLKGLATGLSGPSFIAVDLLHNELFVANSDPGSVTVYELTAAGDTPPKRTIKGPDFNPLYFAMGLAVDLTHDELFVGYGFLLNFFTIAVYHRDADGAAVPIRILHGDLMELDGPSALALDLTHDELFVANDPTGPLKGGFINVYSRTASDLDNPGPIRNGPATGLGSPVALALTSAFDYTLTNSGNVTVPAGIPASGTTTITATLLAGSGTVTFQSQSPFVSGLPMGATASFTSPTCSPSCSTTLTITTDASIPRGTYEITVTVVECSEGVCNVGGSTSFDLVVGPIVGPLQVDKAGNGTCTVVSDPAGIDCGATCSATFLVGPPPVRLRATPASDAFFVGWSGGGCGVNNPCEVTVAPSLTSVTATCNLIRAQLKVNTIGSGTGMVTVTSTATTVPAGVSCGQNCLEYELPFGTPVTLTAASTTPAPGSSFRWSDGPCAGSTLPTCTFPLMTPTTANATFTRRVTLTVITNGSGSGTVTVTSSATTIPAGVSCGQNCLAYVVDLDTLVTLTASADAGSTFAGWSGGGCSGTGPCTLTLGAPTTVTATCNLVLPLTVVTSGKGSGVVTSGETPPRISCGATCSETFDSGTPVTLTATPGSGSTFAGWSQPVGSNLPRCGGAGPCRITITRNTSVNAYFVHTPQEAFIARLYVNLLGEPPPSPDNIQQLIDALTPLPTLTVRALLDAFLDGRVFNDRLLPESEPELSPADYVTVLFRAILAREPHREELAEGIRRFPEGRKAIEDAVIDSDEFRTLFQALFPGP